MGKRSRLRAGEEPAQDLKRRIESTLLECGLQITESRMRLLRDKQVRCVMVRARIAGHNSENAGVDVLGIISIGGELQGGLRLYCMASNEDALTAVYSAPLMSGRDAIQMDRLKEAVQATLVERATVMRRLAEGDLPPFVFDDVIWAPFPSTLT